MTAVHAIVTLWAVAVGLSLLGLALALLYGAVVGVRTVTGARRRDRNRVAACGPLNEAFTGRTLTELDEALERAMLTTTDHSAT
jgi:hypothetical protein